MPTQLGPGATSSQRLVRRRNAVLRKAVTAAVALTGLSFACLPARAATVTSTWNVGANGNWNDATKWTNSPSATTFPNNGNLSNTYDVVLNSGTATLNVPVTIHNLTLSGGVIGTAAANPAPGTNTLTVTGNFRWSAGSFQAPVTVASGGSFAIDTSTGSTLRYGGTLTLGGAGSFAGTNAAAILANRPDTRFNILSTGLLTLDRQLSLSLPPTDPFGTPQNSPYLTMNNAGLITLGAGSAVKTTAAPIMLMNTGTVRATAASELGFSYAESSGLIDLQTASAALTFRAAPAPDSVVLSGGVRLAAGSALTFAQGGVLLNAPSFTNAGTINLWYDTRVAAPTTIPGAVNFGSNVTTLTVAAPLTLTGRAVFSYSSGSRVSGTGRLTAYDFKPLGIGFTGTELYIPAAGTLDMGANSSVAFDTGARLTVDGKIAWDRSGGGVNAVGIGAARVDLGATALVDVRPSAAASFALRTFTSGPVAFDPLNNAGTIQVDHATFGIGENWALNNSGTLRVMTGGSATISSALVTNSGTIDLQAGSALLVNGRTYNSAADALGVNFRNAPTGVLRVGVPLTATFRAPFSGQLTNEGLIEVNGGLLQDDNYALANSGTVRVTAGTARLGGAKFSNTATGAVAVGAGAIEITANRTTNAGRIDLGAGATLTVTAAGDAAGATAFQNAAGGTMTVGGSAVASFTAGVPTTFANAGTLNLDHGRLTLGDGWGLSNSGVTTVTSTAFKLALRSFTNTGRVDLRDGGGVVMSLVSYSGGQSAGLQRTHDMIASGYHGGAWDGPGIDSASAASDPTTAVGYAVATGAGTFLGVPVATGDILVRHTKSGDATLDGTVNFADLLALAKNYNATGAHWYQGDFNYDGSVNFADLLTLAKNYNSTMPAADAVPGAPAAFAADLAAAFGQVPEPSAGLLAITACGFALAARRRRVR